MADAAPQLPPDASGDGASGHDRADDTDDDVVEVVDETPITSDVMNRNKESLEMRLQRRRPLNQLIDQGILPRKCRATHALTSFRLGTMRGCITFCYACSTHT